MTQYASNNVLTLSATPGENTQVMNDRYGKRRSLIIQNNNGSALLYMAKGIAAIDATVPAALKLLPTSFYVESNSEGFICWQGAIQMSSDTASATVTILETWEE